MADKLGVRRDFELGEIKIRYVDQLDTTFAEKIVAVNPDGSPITAGASANVAKATAAAPAYIEGALVPLSVDLAGSLRSGGGGGGGLTDAQLRASPVAVAFTAAQHVIVDSASLGTVAVSGPLTDAQLAARLPLSVAFTSAQHVIVDSASLGTVAVSGPLTDAQLAARLPLSVAFTAAQHVIVDSASLGTVAISAISLPLPAGAAQDATLLTIDADIRAQARLIDTQPVSLAAAPLPTGAAADASLATIHGDLEQIINQTRPVSQLPWFMLPPTQPWFAR